MPKLFLPEDFKSEKVLDINECARVVDHLIKEGKIVGLCHGRFDLLHPGHVKHFQSSKKLCDILVVSITSDRYAESRKKRSNLYDQHLRAYIVSNIRFVDYVTISDFDLAVEVIKMLKPSLYIKGPDYTKTRDNVEKERLEREIESIESVGGRMVYTNDTTFSTTDILRVIKNGPV